MVVNGGSGVRSGYAIRYAPKFSTIVNSSISINRGTILRNYAMNDNDLVKVGTAIVGNTIVNGGYLINTNTLIARGGRFPSGSLVVNIPTGTITTVSNTGTTGVTRGTTRCSRGTTRFTGVRGSTRSTDGRVWVCCVRVGYVAIVGYWGEHGSTRFYVV